MATERSADRPERAATSQKPNQLAPERRAAPSATQAPSGSYHQYLKSILAQPYSLTVRCQCGRSRPISHLFFCTKCATDDADDASAMIDSLLPADDDDTNETGEYFCCDLCSKRTVESYFCPSCSNIYPQRSVAKQYTRCQRCVACPVCLSQVEKIVLTSSNKYMYQCRYCYWTSESVGLSANDSKKLVELLNTETQRPIDEATQAINNIVDNYLQNNEKVRPKGQATGFGSSYMSRPARFGRFGTARTRYGSAKPKPRRQLHHFADRNWEEACQKIDDKILEKHEKAHTVPHEPAENKVEMIDTDMITRFDPTSVSPLEHRLADPLRQTSDFRHLFPQKFHLLTREAYRCPQSNCNSYVYKPMTTRNRSGGWEVRELAVNYLPRMTMRLNDELLYNNTTTVIVTFTNRHDDNVIVQLNPDVNHDDLHSPFSTADVLCNSHPFELNPKPERPRASQPTKTAGAGTGSRPETDGSATEEKKDHFSESIEFHVTPRYYKVEVQFSVMMTVKMNMKVPAERNDDESTAKTPRTPLTRARGISDPAAMPAATEETVEEKAPEIKPIKVKYILDFNLGHTKDVTDTGRPPARTTARMVSQRRLQGTGVQQRGSSRQLPPGSPQSRVRTASSGGIPTGPQPQQPMSNMTLGQPGP